jgi:p-hydroxybenzoate 3-monooxygenase
VLEDTTTNILDRLGINARMHAEGLLHGGVNLADGERLIRIDIEGLTGRTVMVYGQTEVTRDLIDAAPERGLQVIWEAEDVALHAIGSESPYVTFARHGVQARIDARFIAGCDGYHGPSRQAIPASVARHFERAYPFGWLGILADVPPCNAELIYANHELGFALASMRSRTRSRYYIRCQSTRCWTIGRMSACGMSWKSGRPGVAHIAVPPALEKSIAPLRSFVFEPMRHSRLLAGDAAHRATTGAKGLNLAASGGISLGGADWLVQERRGGRH